MNKVGLGNKRKRGISRKYTDEFLLGKLKELGVQLGRTPSFRDIKSEKSFPAPSTYFERFGRLSVALKKAGFNPRELIISDEEKERRKTLAVQAIQEFYKRESRIPTLGDLGSQLQLGMSEASVFRLFGSWTNAIEIAFKVESRSMPWWEKLIAIFKR